MHLKNRVAYRNCIYMSIAHSYLLCTLIFKQRLIMPHSAECGPHFIQTLILIHYQ